VAWEHGSLVEPALEDEPDEAPGDIAELLDSAEDIVNAIVPDAIAQARRDEASKQSGRLGRLFRRRR
jgi:hypothetical protein